MASLVGPFRPYLDGRSFDEMFARHATWRASDHMVTHDFYVVDVLLPPRLRAPHA